MKQDAGVACSASLHLGRARKDRQRGPTEEAEARAFAVWLPKSFFRIFRKSIDRRNVKVPAGSLSLMGRLFEIYFVRLIGTPNQNSKNGALTSVKHLALTSVSAEYSSS